MQSSIDALTFGTSRSGDLQTSLPNEDFEITFSVSLRSSASIENDEGERVDEDSDKNLIDSSGYYVNADGDYVEKAGESKVVDSGKRVKASDAKRYHYNEEAVKINVEGAMIKKVGRHDIVL